MDENTTFAEPPELMDSLTYSLLPPEERDMYAWDEDLELYFQVPQPDKFTWSTEDLVPVN